MNIVHIIIQKALKTVVTKGRRYICAITALILILANLNFIGSLLIASNKSAFSASNGEDINPASGIKSNLVAIRSYCSICEGILNDSQAITSNSFVSIRNNYSYAAYLYNQALIKINETLNILSDISVPGNKETASLSAELQQKQSEINVIINSLINLMASLNIQSQPSTTELEKLKSTSSSLTSYFNNIIQ